MQPKTILICGSTGAIGAAAAKTLAATGAELVLLARSAKKAELLINEISSGLPDAKISVLEGDLTDFESLKKVSEEFNSKFGKLDLFINSTAIFKDKKTLLPNGFEETFAANYLGYFLLTNLLLTSLKKSENAIVLNIVPPSKNKIDFSDIQKLQNYGGLKCFNNTSVCKAVITVELARQLRDTSVSAVNFNPGFVKNQGQKSVPGIIGFILRTAASVFADEPEVTAKIIAKLVAEFKPEKWNGKFLNNKLEDKSIPYQADEAVGKRLWAETNKMLGTQF